MRVETTAVQEIKGGIMDICSQVYGAVAKLTNRSGFVLTSISGTTPRSAMVSGGCGMVIQTSVHQEKSRQTGTVTNSSWIFLMF
jgi:hypothetical protein